MSADWRSMIARACAWAALGWVMRNFGKPEHH
jgi:hypothetical protein